jgi:hypothetical protein
MWRIMPASVAIMIGLVSAAAAASCREELALFAQQYNLAADLPRAEPPAGAAEAPATQESRGASPSDILSRSGGVVAPPEGSGRTVVIEPPAAGTAPMPTTPALRPHTSQQPSTRPSELSAAKRTQIESLVQAARAAEAQGKEAECFERLVQARALAEPG